MHTHFDAAVTAYTGFARWDLWDDAVEDGSHAFKPSDQGSLVSIASIATLLELCTSPFVNPSGHAVVDCAVLTDIAEWPAE